MLFDPLFFPWLLTNLTCILRIGDAKYCRRTHFVQTLESDLQEVVEPEDGQVLQQVLQEVLPRTCDSDCYRPQ